MSRNCESCPARILCQNDQVEYSRQLSQVKSDLEEQKLASLELADEEKGLEQLFNNGVLTSEELDDGKRKLDLRASTEPTGDLDGVRAAIEKKWLDSVIEEAAYSGYCEGASWLSRREQKLGRNVCESLYRPTSR